MSCKLCQTRKFVRQYKQHLQSLVSWLEDYSLVMRALVVLVFVVWTSSAVDVFIGSSL